MGSDSEKKRKRKKKEDKKEWHKHKKNKHKKKKSKKERKISSSCSSESSLSDTWIEKPVVETKNSLISNPEREEWMSFKTIATYNKEKDNKDDKKIITEQYDPKKSSRELNPYWKEGDGTGLPSFKKPCEDDYYLVDNKKYSSSKSDGWKKVKIEASSSSSGSSYKPSNSKLEDINHTEEPITLSKDDLNKLSAKVMKAELMGDLQLAKELTEKLEKAKAFSKTNKDVGKSNNPEIQFTTKKHSIDNKDRSKQKSKSQKVVVESEYSMDLSNKFCLERNENDNLDAQFYKISTKLNKQRDNLDNIFDHEKASTSTGKTYEEKTVTKMNSEIKAQQDCDKCINSDKFNSDYIISLGKNVYLAIPRDQGLTPLHCIIVPMVHCPALTFLDEDVFSEIVEFCKYLSRMFNDNKMDFVFFETVRYLNRQPHTYIECVQSKENFEMIAFYFKKAILESETDWAMNKKLHNVNKMEIRKVIPKGLPYFWINFNFENGFAHAIEDQETFRHNFAHETIAGMLNLSANSWRKPGKEYNPIIKVNNFKRLWKKYDFTEK